MKVMIRVCVRFISVFFSFIFSLNYEAVDKMGKNLEFTGMDKSFPFEYRYVSC